MKRDMGVIGSCIGEGNTAGTRYWSSDCPRLAMVGFALSLEVLTFNLKKATVRVSSEGPSALLLYKVVTNHVTENPHVDPRRRASGAKVDRRVERRRGAFHNEQPLPQQPSS